MYYNFRHHSLIAVTLLLPVHIMAHDATATKELASISIEATDVLSSASSEGYYQPIVNGATRTDVPLLELPQSVKVITEETLDDLNAFRINDALDFVSGVSRQNNFGGTWDNIAVRGFAGNENTGMSMMRNGFSSNRGINPPRDMANVQSIEFLKGPSAALYGNSEPGGTLNIITKKPEFKSKHAVDASIGSYDFYRVTIDSTAALSSNFAYRLNVAQEDKGSFRDYIDSSRTLIAPAFTWLINNKTTLSYDGEFLRQKAPLDRGLVSIDGDTAAVPIENFLGNPADGDITLNSQNHQLSLTHEITDEWDAHIGVAHKRGSLEGLASEVRPFTIVTGDSVNLRTRYRDYQTTDTTLQADVHGKLKEHDLLIGTEIYQFTNDQILNNRNKRKALITAKMLVPLMKKDKYIGKVGTKDRDEYEYELRMDILSRMIKTARQERNLTQEQLGSLIGVQKSQISKLESSSNSASIDTLLKVFKALKAEIHFNVKMEEDYLELV